MSRMAEVARQTRETRVRVRWELDGGGNCQVETGLPFFDHMLEQIGRHGLFDLEVSCQGDLAVDSHHSIEDTGIVLGQALAKALGDRSGIARFGEATIPLDESLCQVVVDLSGRPFLAVAGDWPVAPAGGLWPEVWPEFWRALAQGAGINLHIRLLAGQNAHHAVEAAFKGLGRALRMAVAPDPRQKGVPSTKGVLG